MTADKPRYLVTFTVLRPNGTQETFARRLRRHAIQDFERRLGNESPTGTIITTEQETEPCDSLS